MRRTRFEMGAYRHPRPEWSGRCCRCRERATLKIWPSQPDPGLYCDSHRPESYVQAKAHEKAVGAAIREQSKRWMDELLASHTESPSIPLDPQADLFQQKE